MTSGKDLQEKIALTLEGSGVLPGDIVPVRWRKKDMRSNNELTLAVQKTGLAVIVPVPVPTSALQGTPIVFFDKYQVRVQILEMPELTRDRDEDLYDLIDTLALALHWQPREVESPLYGMLAHPLYLAERPVEMQEGLVDAPGMEHHGAVVRGADLIFEAVLQINETE